MDPATITTAAKWLTPISWVVKLVTWLNPFRRTRSGREAYEWEITLANLAPTTKKEIANRFFRPDDESDVGFWNSANPVSDHLVKIGVLQLLDGHPMHCGTSGRRAYSLTDWARKCLIRHPRLLKGRRRRYWHLMVKAR